MYHCLTAGAAAFNINYLYHIKREREGEERERERERERQTDRETDRQTDRQTEKGTMMAKGVL